MSLQYNLKNAHAITLRKILVFSLKFVLLALLIFGEHFTKFYLIEPISVYDVILVSTSAMSLFFVKKLRQRRVAFFLLISIIYFLYSLLYNDSLMYVVRQYMIVGYLMLIYLIFQKVQDKSDELIKYIIFLSKLSINLQLLFLIYAVGIKQNTLFGDFNYLSPLSVMLLPVYTAWVLINEKTRFYKITRLILVLFISVTLGHSSAFFAVVVTIFGFFLVRITRKQLLIVLSAVIITVISFYLFLPQFQDANANWRLFYWGKGLNKTIESYFLGNGFGVPFITFPEIYDMVDIFGNDNDLLDSPQERYIKAYHNSFLTLFFHLGIWVVLLSEPFMKAINYLRVGVKDKENDLLTLSFIGMTTWCFFNVVLELPHSSILYWLVFLLVLQKTKTPISLSK